MILCDEEGPSDADYFEAAGSFFAEGGSWPTYHLTRVTEAPCSYTGELPDRPHGVDISSGYDIHAGSPAYNAGNATYGTTTDRHQDTRVGLPDVGADEVIGAPGAKYLILRKS